MNSGSSFDEGSVNMYRLSNMGNPHDCKNIQPFIGGRTAREISICANCFRGVDSKTPAKEPCRKHFWQGHESGPCPDCGCRVEAKPPAPPEGWEDSYPLGTFQGETKRELVALIGSLLARRDAEARKEERERIVNTIRHIKSD